MPCMPALPIRPEITASEGGWWHFPGRWRGRGGESSQAMHSRV